VTQTRCLEDALAVRVVHHFLVECVSTEGPHLVLINPVVDGRLVVGWRVGVERLSLDVGESDSFIVVIEGDGRSNTHNVLGVGGERLLSLKVVDFLHNNIIHVLVL